MFKFLKRKRKIYEVIIDIKNIGDVFFVEIIFPGITRVWTKIESDEDIDNIILKHNYTITNRLYNFEHIKNTTDVRPGFTTIHTFWQRVECLM